MCTTGLGTLTLAGMLDDPLIKAVMRSDGVSEGEHSALLFRVKDQLAEREVSDERAREAAEHWT